MKHAMLLMFLFLCTIDILKGDNMIYSFIAKPILYVFAKHVSPHAIWYSFVRMASFRRVNLMFGEKDVQMKKAFGEMILFQTANVHSHFSKTHIC